MQLVLDCLLLMLPMSWNYLKLWSGQSHFSIIDESLIFPASSLACKFILEFPTAKKLLRKAPVHDSWQQKTLLPNSFAMLHQARCVTSISSKIFQMFKAHMPVYSAIAMPTEKRGTTTVRCLLVISCWFATCPWDILWCWSLGSWHMDGWIEVRTCRS